MRVVSISREVGCGGEDIAGRVAGLLGFRLVTKRVIEQIFTQYGFLNFDRFYEESHGFWDRFDEVQEQSADLLEMVVRAVARAGSTVILGRASFAFLQDCSDVLNVRLWAPLAARVPRFMDRMKISDRREAERQVIQNDRTRARFVHLCVRTRTEALDPFDLTINTEKVPADSAAALVAQAARASEGPGREGLRSTRAFPADPVLDGVIEKALSEERQA